MRLFFFLVTHIDGKALVELPEDAPVKKVLYEILERMGL